MSWRCPADPPMPCATQARRPAAEMWHIFWSKVHGRVQSPVRSVISLSTRHPHSAIEISTLSFFSLSNLLFSKHSFSNLSFSNLSFSNFLFSKLSFSQLSSSNFSLSKLSSPCRYYALIRRVPGSRQATMNNCHCNFWGVIKLLTAGKI